MAAVTTIPQVYNPQRYVNPCQEPNLASGEENEGIELLVEAEGVKVFIDKNTSDIANLKELKKDPKYGKFFRNEELFRFAGKDKFKEYIQANMDPAYGLRKCAGRALDTVLDRAKRDFRTVDEKTGKENISQWKVSNFRNLIKNYGKQLEEIRSQMEAKSVMKPLTYFKEPTDNLSLYI